MFYNCVLKRYFFKKIAIPASFSFTYIRSLHITIRIQTSAGLKLGSSELKASTLTTWPPSPRHMKRYLWSRTFFMKMGHSWPLFLWFLVFLKQTLQFLHVFITMYCEKCPSSIWCWDSNPNRLKRESPLITTRPRLPPIDLRRLFIVLWQNILNIAFSFYENVAENRSCKSSFWKLSKVSNSQNWG